MTVVESEPARARPARDSRAVESPAVDRVLRAGVLLAAFAGAATAASHLVYFGVFDGDAGPLNADAEHGVWAWASSSVTFAAAVAAALLALVVPGRARRALGLAALLALFSLDDAVELHESYGEDFTQSLLGLPEKAAHAVWPALFLPLLATVLLLLLAEARRAEPRVRRLLLAGPSLLAFAVACEASASVLEDDTWPAALEVAAEEGAELAGWTLIAAALAAISLRAAGARR